MTPETPQPLTASQTPWSQRLNNWKMPIIVSGGFLGAAVGAMAARLFIRSDEVALDRDRKRGPQGIGFSPSVMIPLAITLIGLIREIGGLAGDRSEK